MSSGKSKTHEASAYGHVPLNRAAPDLQSRIIIISDTRLYREGLALSLERVDRVIVVGVADSVASALTCIQDKSPNVALLDFAMPDALALPDAIAAAQIPVKVVAFSVAETDDEICECAEAGIAGYVARNGSKEDLIAAVENAVRGEVLCSPRVAASLFRRLAAHVQTTKQRPPQAALSGREQDIIALIDRGLSNKEIARQLKISLATVKNHVHNILEKLQVRRRGAAAALLREAALARATAPRSPTRQQLGDGKAREAINIENPVGYRPFLGTASTRGRFRWG
ncbi:MAG TPA: response regulator transcription factor [Stellaceae bacterium]|nr:response regulator transcription factor [Stellaceae bacterium]